MISFFFKSRIGLLILLTIIFVGISSVLLNKVQNYSKVLGIATGTCSGAFDLNCDSQTNFNDTKTLISYIAVATDTSRGRGKGPKPTVSPTPTPSTTPTPTPKTTIATSPSPAPSPGTSPSPTPTPTTVRNPDGTWNPYPSAPLCTHTTDKFHTLWDPVVGCHYDHEHGDNPFTPAIAASFPRTVLGNDLRGFLGGVEIAHTNHSGPAENTTKHGGFKWQAQATTPNGCVLGFEDAQVAVNAIAVQYHAFGNYAIEMESRVHSLAALMRQCKPDSTDYGYVYTVQHVDYGQRVSGYTGDLVPYPDSPSPSYEDSLGPYFTIDCIGRGSPPCGRYTSYAEYVAANGNTSTTWTSKSPYRLVSSGSPLLMVLFRARDTYQILDFTDSVYPFTFLWMCSRDNGSTFTSFPGCRHNNTTTRVHEVAGTIPAAWDNKAGFDTDPRVGRITATGYTTRFGNLDISCTAVGPDCHPIKLVNAYVGKYGSLLIPDKIAAFIPEALPERDIYFCNGSACNEFSYGARTAGWVGPNN
jgi:hypothetical protein